MKRYLRGLEEKMSGTAEQQARDMLVQCGVEDAQSFTAGDVVVLANFIAEANRLRATVEHVRHLCSDSSDFDGRGNFYVLVDDLLNIIDDDR
jgi:hypothetical protein